jgi:hypothetical protein
MSELGNSEVVQQHETVELPVNEDTVSIPVINPRDTKLFFGSRTSHKTSLREAEENTLGKGLYLTSSVDAARNYADVRTRGSDGSATLYTVGVGDMRLIDLRTREAEEKFGRFFAEKVDKWRREVLPGIETISPVHKISLQRIAANVVAKGRTGSFRGLKDITSNLDETVRDCLFEYGVDGLVAIEGGEGPNGRNHDSFVIFDPSKAKIISERPAA